MPVVGGVELDSEYFASPRSTARPGLGDLLASGATGAWGALRYGLPYAVEKAVGTATAEDDKYYQAWLAHKAAQAQEIAPTGPAGLEDIAPFGVGGGPGKVGLGRAFLENLAFSLPYMGASLVGGVGGGLAGGPAGALAGAVAAGSGQFTGTNTQRAAEDGEFTREEALKSIGVAPAQAALDVAVARFVPGLGKAFGVGASAQAGSIAKRVAASGVKGAATEATTEAAQQVGERFAAGLPMTDREAMHEVVSSFAIGGLLGGGLGAMGGIRKSKTLDPNQMTNEVLDQLTAEPLGVAGLLPAPPDAYVDAAGRASTPEEGGIGTLLATPRATDTLELGEDQMVPEGTAQRLLEANPTLFGQEGRPAMRTLQDVGPDIRAQLRQMPAGDIMAAIERLTQAEEFGPREQGMASLLFSELQERETASRPQLPAPDTDAAFGNTLGEVADNSPAARLSAALREMPGGDIRAALEREQTKEQPNDLMVQALRRELDARRRDPSLNPREPSFEEKLTEVKRGLRGGFVQQVEAQSEEELLGKVYDQVFVEQDQRTNTQRFAQRLGLLDENLEPTDLARQVEARKAEQDANTFLDEGISVADTKAAMAFANKPDDARRMQVAMMARGDRQALETQVLKALGVSPVTDPAAREASAADPLAQRRLESRDTKLNQAAVDLGLVRKDGELSAKGRLAAARIEVPTETVIQAAQRQGFTGAQAAMFERGATGTVVRNFDSISEAAAYKAGQEWKVPLTAGEQATRDALYGKEGTAKKGSLAKGKADKVERGRVDSLTPEQDRRQRFMAAIDEYNFPAGRDADVKILREMVDNGATDGELDEAAAKIMQGKSLFKQPPPKPMDFKGETVVRGQPRSKLARAGDVTEVQTKAGQRKESAKLARAFLVREELRAAHDSGDLDRLSFMQATGLLEKGDIDAAIKFLPGRQKRLALGEISGTSHAESVKLERAIEGKSAHEVLRYIGNTAPNAFYRVLASRVANAMSRMEKAGFRFHTEVVRSPAAARELLGDERALGASEVTETADVYVYIASTAIGPGPSYEVLLHEFIHAVTQTLLDTPMHQLRKVPRAYKAVQDLKALSDAVLTHIRNRERQGDKLTALEIAILDGKTNALTDVHELVAWGLTDTRVQEYLNALDYTPTQTFWSFLVDTIRTFLGIPARDGSALMELLRASDDLMKVGSGGFVNLYGDDLTTPTGAVHQLNTAAGDTIKAVGQAADRIFAQPLSAAQWLRERLLGGLSLHHIAQHYGDMFINAVTGRSAVTDVEAAEFDRRATETRFAQLFQQLDDQRAEMLKKAPKLGETLNKLMNLTEFQIDPTRGWDAQTHLHNLPNVPELKELVRKGNQWYGNLREAGFQHVYDNLRSVNEANSYASLSMLMYNLVSVSPELKAGISGADTNPVDAFRADASLHGSPQAARDYWKAQVEAQMDGATEFIKELRGAVSGDVKEMAAANNQVSPIEMQMLAARSHIAAMEQAPYSHLGRFGDHFVAFELRKVDGRVDKQALNRVIKRLEETGHDDIQVSRETVQSRVYIRVASDAARLRLEKVAQEFQKQGLLMPDDAGVYIKSGPRAASNAVGRGATAESLNKLVQAIEASPMFQATEDMTAEEKQKLAAHKEQVTATMREIWLDALPDISMAKVMTRRNAVLGQSKDMFRAYAHRAQVSAKSLASLSATPKFNEAFTAMRAATNASLNVGDPRHADTRMMHAVYKELALRQAQTADAQNDAPIFDQVRAVTHSYFLGLSPAYFLLNITQLGVMLWPQLGSKHGFVESARAISRVTPMAFKILKAQAELSAGKGAARVADVTITADSLKRAGVSPGDAEFIMQMLARAKIDLGSATREMAQLADPSSAPVWLDTALKVGSSFGLYSETFNRLVSVLAARELYKDGKVKGQSVEDYADFIVDETMLNYSAANAARWTGKRGMLGPATPLVTQFMQYSLQVTEKLYREFYGALKGADAETRKEARRFLAGHAVAVMSLAGTLGLPFATVVASAIERLVDLFDDDEEPFDVTAAYRNWLSEVFGEGMGEVIARGGPRALGFDLSTRAGEQDLLPFSRFLADRRSWKDKVGTQLDGATGPVGSMTNNFIEGTGKIFDGDFTGGLVQAMPTFLRNPVQVYRMTTEGYVDSRGNKLPMTPQASAYLAQAIGFSPAEKAEETERQGDQRQRKGILTREATVLRNNIVKAIMRGDNEAAREYLREAQSFDAANPAYAVIPDIESSIKRRMRNEAIARATKTPIGVSPKDIAGQELTRYANVN